MTKIFAIVFSALLGLSVLWVVACKHSNRLTPTSGLNDRTGASGKTGKAISAVMSYYY